MTHGVGVAKGEGTPVASGEGVGYDCAVAVGSAGTDVAVAVGTGLGVAVASCVAVAGGSDGAENLVGSAGVIEGSRVGGNVVGVEAAGVNVDVGVRVAAGVLVASGDGVQPASAALIAAVATTRTLRPLLESIGPVPVPASL